MELAQMEKLCETEVFWHGFSIDVCNQREIQKTVYEITGEKRFKVIIL